MATTVKSFSTIGVNGQLITIETDIIHGMPGVSIVGMGDTAIKEAKERLQAAISNSGFEFPQKKIIINLAPSDIKKSGSSFDLGMAIGLLLRTNQIKFKGLENKNIGFIGELSLNGNLRPCNGVLSMVMEAKKNSLETVIVPKNSFEEASLINNINIIGANSLKDVTSYLIGDDKNVITELEDKDNIVKVTNDLDFSEVKGQNELIRYIQIAVAGGHNILMVGSPGCGKSMIAKRIPTILPEMTEKEALEVTKIYSVINDSNKSKLIKSRPFRAPHHNASINSLVGGGRTADPGEISLAHNGILFLDEIPQFSKKTLDSLRQPLEDGYVTISRVNQTNKYPSRFMLVAAMNPCPCGHHGDKKCRCSDYEILKYRQKISGPIMDRIDIQKYVHPIDFLKDYSDEERLTSKKLRQEVKNVRNIQTERFKENDNISCNAQMNSALINKYCVLDDKCKKIMKDAYKKYNFSARSYNKYLKIARTFADYNGHEKIEKQDVFNALRSRDLDSEENSMLVI